MRYLSLIIIGLLPFAVNCQHDRFAMVLASVTDENTRNKLQIFKEKGIEFTLDTRNLNKDDLIAAAKAYLNYPHCMGGNGKTTINTRKQPCIDCSGLIRAAFMDVGIHIELHSSQELARYGKIIVAKEMLKKGDMVFFINSYVPSDSTIVITHSGLMVDDQHWIHTSSGKGVIIQHINNPWWTNKFLYGTRIF